MGQWTFKSHEELADNIEEIFFFFFLGFHVFLSMGEYKGEKQEERWGERVHSQLLTPEAPEGKFDQFSVNQR